MVTIYPIIIALMYTINTLKKINVSYKKKNDCACTINTLKKINVSYKKKKKIVLYPYNGIKFSKKGYKPVPTTQMSFTDIMLNVRHKECVLYDFAV